MRRTYGPRENPTPARTVRETVETKGEKECEMKSKPGLEDKREREGRRRRSETSLDPVGRWTRPRGNVRCSIGFTTVLKVERRKGRDLRAKRVENALN